MFLELFYLKQVILQLLSHFDFSYDYIRDSIAERSEDIEARGKESLL